MIDGTGNVTGDQLRQEIEHIRRAAASVVFMADRLLVEHYAMPQDKRLILSRQERQEFVRGVTNDSNGDGT